MHFGLSASGPKAETLARLSTQRQSIVADQPGAATVVDAALAHVTADLADVADTESVTVSVSCDVSISKPIASIE